MSETTGIVPVGGIATKLEGEDVTHFMFILDRSGSMQGKEDDVIGGFNGYVETLRTSDEGQVGISYLCFDNRLELVWNDVPLAAVPQMTRETYNVRGSTALLDAVGTTISAVKENAAHRYVVLTHTDGMENASREWTVEAVKAAISEREARGNWSFAFFGEGIDAWAQAERYGYDRRSTMNYDKSEMRDVYASKGRVSNVMRERKVASSRAFAAATEAAMRDKGVTDDDLERILKDEGG